MQAIPIKDRSRAISFMEKENKKVKIICLVGFIGMEIGNKENSNGGISQVHSISIYTKDILTKMDYFVEKEHFKSLWVVIKVHS